MSATPECPRGALCFDFGTRQIGVAYGQTLSRTARPLAVLRARDGQPQWDEVASLIAEWRPSLLVVGLPLNMDGSESDFCQRARKFARRLHGRFGLETLMVDERLSTREAKTRSGPRESYREDPIDNLAAQIILESWLNEPGNTCAP